MIVIKCINGISHNVNCATCGSQSSFDKGISIVQAGKPKKILYHPIRLVSKGNHVKLSDPHGNEIEVYMPNIVTHNTLPKLVDFINSCEGTVGGGSTSIQESIDVYLYDNSAHDYQVVGIYETGKIYALEVLTPLPAGIEVSIHSYTSNFMLITVSNNSGSDFDSQIFLNINS